MLQEMYLKVYSPKVFISPQLAHDIKRTSDKSHFGKHDSQETSSRVPYGVFYFLFHDQSANSILLCGNSRGIEPIAPVRKSCNS